MHRRYNDHNHTGVTTMRADIQYLRAVAVILVILYHLPPQWNLSGGFIGVDIFFVISGFVITESLKSRISDDRNFGRYYISFMKRRLRRLVAPLAATVTVGLIIAFLFAPISSFRGIATSSIFSAGFSANFFFLKNFNTYWNPELLRNPFLHLWSLAVEFQVYLIWPLLLIPILRGNRRLQTFLLLFASVLSLSTFVYFLDFRSTSFLGFAPDGIAFYSPFTRMWQLGLGGLAALSVNSGVIHRQSYVLRSRFLGLALIVLALVQSTRLENLSLWVAPGCVGTAVLLLADAQTRDTKLLTVLRWAGDRSYSIYLWHWPFLVLATWIMPGSLTWAVVAIMASIVISKFSFDRLERRVPPTGYFINPTTVALSTLFVILAAIPVSDSRWFNSSRSLADLAMPFPDIGPTANDMMDAVAPCRDIPAGLECTNFPDRDDRVMIIGDSLGYRSLPAVQLWSIQHGYNSTIMWTGGCTFAKDSCTAAIGNSLYEYLASHTIAAIFVASNFDRPADRVNGSEKAGGLSPVCDGPTVHCAKHIRWVRDFEIAAELGLRQLEEFSPNIIVSLPYPQQADLPETCLRLPIYQRLLGSRNGNSCGRTSVTWQDRRQGLIPDVIREAVQRHPNVRLWDPKSAFCVNSWCPAIINDGEAMMADAIHWTWPAARFMAPQVAQLLNSFNLPVLGPQ